MAAPLWHEAIAFACRAHLGQIRKDGATPYAAHPARVAMILMAEFGCADEETLAAGALHDVIEDTACDYDDIAERFGGRVADMVAAMTKDMRLPEAERELAYAKAILAGGRRVHLITLADTLDNLRDAGALVGEHAGTGARLRGRAIALTEDLNRALTEAGMVTGSSDEGDLARAIQLVKAAAR